jgi:iron complex outermembrane receptor protein
MIASLAMTAAPVAAQDDDEEEAADLDRVQVTGSRISRTDIEGATPVTTITREDLELTGDSNLADILRSLNFNSFGSFNERSGTTAQSQALLSLRGLGSSRTLVLLNGRRVPNSPVVGAAAVDLNMLPLEAVERVEILRDSASAIYGSDALGGVVNIILRDDYMGGEIKLNVERPSREGRDAENAAFTIGSEFDRGSFLISAEVLQREEINDRDRPWSAPFNPGTGNLGDTRGISEFGNTIIPLEPLPETGFDRIAAPNCPDDIYAGILDTPRGTACTFAYAQESFLTASLDRQSLYVSADYELSSDHRLIFQNYAARNKSTGQYAPAVGLTPVISADNEFNPVDAPILLGHRFVGLGPRTDTQTNYVFDTLAGLEGRFGGMDYDFTLRHNRYESSDFGNTYALASVFSEEVAAGRYNPFDPLRPENEESLDAMAHTISREIRGRYWDAAFTLSGVAADLPAGLLQWAAGAEYRDESFTDANDRQSRAGNVIGSSGGASGGGRDSYAFFTEWLIPITDDIEVTAAGRYDDYEISGDAFSPQVALRWSVMDNLLVRGSWGQGFRAPDVDTLFAAPAQSFEFARDFVVCDQQGIPENECPVFQEETFFLSNRELAPEDSESVNLGIVWEPIERLSLTADVYNTEITDVITSPSVQALINLEREGQALPEGARIVRTESGIIDFVETKTLNIASLEVTGLDATVEYSLPTDIGQFQGELAFSRIWSYDTQQTPQSETINEIGRADTPGNRGSWQFSWSQGNFQLAYSGYWIESTAAGTELTPEGDIALIGKVPSYVQHDIQGTYFAPWNAEVKVGVRNLADRGPSLDSFNQDLSRSAQDLYPVVGRVPYVTYIQKF